MQYLISVIDDTTGSATPAELSAVDAVNERLRAGGHWVFAGGLAAPDTATVVDHRGPAPIVSDGPFVETREYVAGLWIVEAADLDAALDLATAASAACARRVEVRPFLPTPQPE